MNPLLDHLARQLRRPSGLLGKHLISRMLDRVNADREMRRLGGDRYSVMGWVEGPAAEGADLRGVQDFIMDLVIDEPFAIDLMDLCVEVAIDFARAQIQAGADTIGMGDAIASQLSPAMYEELILPREKRIVDAIRRSAAILHSWARGPARSVGPYVAPSSIVLYRIRRRLLA